MLSIMASRLFHDTMIIAENAAIGKFPCLDPIAVTEFDLRTLRKRLDQMIQWEKGRQAEIKAKDKMNENSKKDDAS